jgi:ubiquinone/menaquinone biosynthesis C-methylase UbiE
MPPSQEQETWMTTILECDVSQVAAPPPDFKALKNKQQSAWASGDYAVLGTTLQIVGEELAEAMDLRAGQKVLDVAAGNGNATLAAARRWCDVTSTDYVEALLQRGRQRAEAEALSIDFRQADAEALPFPDESFDAVVSTFGVMFTPDQSRASAEMIRILKPGGRIGLANWTPEGFIGQIFKTIGRYVPPPAGLKSPLLWGTREWIQHTFGPPASVIRIENRFFRFRYRSPQHLVDVFRTYYGPMLKAFEALGQPGRRALALDILGLVEKFNSAANGPIVVPGEYLEIVVTKR